MIQDKLKSGSLSKLICIRFTANQETMKTMNLTPFVLCALLLATSCKSKSKMSDTSIPATDTTIASQAIINEMEPAAAAPVVAVSSKSASQRSSNTGTKASATKTTSATSSGTTSNTTEPAPKTGWSKTAKGAVIGGVVGAGTGAVINKKNRAAGAVIGGVVGAGAGAVIGNEADKKDGRH
jgi:hypothetical protein